MSEAASQHEVEARAKVVHNLKRARKARNLTQQQLADKAGIRQSVIAKWETEKVFPSNRSIESVARALGIPPEWFYQVDQPVPAEEDAPVSVVVESDDVLLELTMKGRECVVIDLARFRELKERESQLSGIARQLAAMGSTGVASAALGTHGQHGSSGGTGFQKV